MRSSPHSAPPAVSKADPEDDANIKALLDSQTPVCTIFGKTWTLHVKEVLLTTPEDNLRIIEQSVAYLKANGKRVIYDAEHFFDGYKADSSYAFETLQAAIRGGAETVVLCDTNGGTMPWEVEQIIRDLKPALNHPFGIHTHNDSECAVINSLTAIREGAMQVQGTINGVGERCGNANLISIMADLELKMGYQCLPEGNSIVFTNFLISSQKWRISHPMNICLLLANLHLRTKVESMWRR